MTGQTMPTTSLVATCVQLGRPVQGSMISQRQKAMLVRHQLYQLAAIQLECNMRTHCHAQRVKADKRQLRPTSTFNVATWTFTISSFALCTLHSKEEHEGPQTKEPVSWLPLVRTAKNIVIVVIELERYSNQVEQATSDKLT